MKIILASNSTYRNELMGKLGLEFNCIKPEINEEELKYALLQSKLSPVAVAEALSYEKGNSIFKHQDKNTLVISGDQLVSFENQILGKPLTQTNAILQLNLLNNKSHKLITAITVFSESETVKHNHISTLKMKNLTQTEIKNYIHKDNPLDCSGSYKIEKNGITLFESIECNDFTAIQGIPMLWLSNYLKGAGFELFKN